MYFQRVGVYVSRTEAFFLSVKIVLDSDFQCRSWW